MLWAECAPVSAMYSLWIQSIHSGTKLASIQSMSLNLFALSFLHVFINLMETERNDGICLHITLCEGQKTQST